MLIITSDRVLRNTIDSLMGGDADAESVQRVTDAIQTMDHPAWGSDWVDFLESIDLWQLEKDSQ